VGLKRGLNGLIGQYKSAHLLTDWHLTEWGS